MVKSNNRQTTGHGLNRHIAKSFRQTGKHKHISAGVMGGKIFTSSEAGKYSVGGIHFELLQHGAIANKH